MTEDGWCRYCKKGAKESGLTICEDCAIVRHATLEEVKKRIKDLYHQIGKVEVWRAGNDEVCDLCEERVNGIIDQLAQEGK